MKKQKPLIVFIAMTGEKHQGGYIVGIHRTYSQARKAALAVKCHFDDLQWHETESDHWENGCDYVTVLVHFVDN